MRYEFGRNWARFVDGALSEGRIEIARAHLLRFLGLESLAGKSFLDIGSGSGIHSLAAWRSEASRVHSFDFDGDSVETTRRLRELAGSPTHWEVTAGSVLDRPMMSSLSKADVVYSWGVLHHTGAMWQALENAALAMHETSVLYVALYCSDVYIVPTPEHWLATKQRYNRAGPVGRFLMECRYAASQAGLGELRRGRPVSSFRQLQHYVRMVRNYERQRGMAYWTDVRDWLGGWPMEFASIAETKRFCAERLGLELINIKAGEGCAEYLFRRRGARNYWDAYVESLPPAQQLLVPFRHVAGRCYAADLPGESASSDTPDNPNRSQLLLYEDGTPLGFGHAPEHDIVAHGTGRHRHWGPLLSFSSSDGTDPNTNGRVYTYRARGGF